MRLTVAILSALALFCVSGAAVADPGKAPKGMVLIPGGLFFMGTDEEDLPELAEMGKDVPHMSEDLARGWFGHETPKHRVEMAPFYMDVHEVTNAAFGAFIEATGRVAEGPWKDYDSWERRKHPVVGVTWADATAYARWAGKRLPTEAEWEYAARGGMGVKWFPWGDLPDPRFANYRAQGESFVAGLLRLVGLRKIGTSKVGQYIENDYGLFDVCGNVREWCADAYGIYEGAIDDVIPDDEVEQFGCNGGEDRGTLRAVRGGSWDSPNAVFIRIRMRSGFAPEYYARTLGFRCAKSCAD